MKFSKMMKTLLVLVLFLLPTQVSFGDNIIYDNIAMDNIITVSSSLSAEFKAENMIDGKPETIWKSDPRVETDWIVIDFQHIKEIDGIGINWDKTEYAVEFEISVSINGQEWPPLFEAQNGEGEFVRYFRYSDDKQQGQRIQCRYIKLNCRKKNAQLFTIKEIELYIIKEFITPTPTPTPQLVNIAPKKPIVASSRLSSSYSEYFANDNIMDTAWLSAQSGKPEWIYVDLQSITEVNGIGLKWLDKNFSSLYDVYMSNDGKTWKFLATINNTVFGDDIFTENISFNTRYLGFHFRKNDTLMVGLRELEIYQWQYPVKRTDLPHTNIACGSTAYQSSYYNNDPLYKGDKVVDCSESSAWKSEIGDVNPWVFIDLGSKKTVNGVGIKWYDIFYANTYTIGISFNASKWYTKYVIKSNTKNSKNYFYADVSFRYMGVLCNTTPAETFGIRELEVYQTP